LSIGRFRGASFRLLGATFLIADERGLCSAGSEFTSKELENQKVLLAHPQLLRRL